VFNTASCPKTSCIVYPKKDFDFAFVWNVVRSGEYSNQEKKSKKGNQYVRALHVEVPVEQKQQIYSILLKIFSSSSSIKIHEMKLRMVPTWKKEYTSHRKQKIQHLINKHKHYLATTSHVVTTDFTDIDYLNKKLKMTLRQILMKIETLVPIDDKDKCPKIFQSIDYSTYYSGYVLTFPTYLTQQATDMAPQLPSFLYWLYGNEILPMLTPEASIMAIEEPWDPELMRTISKIDTALDALAGEVEHDFEWLSGSEDEKDPDVLQENAAKEIDMSNLKTGEFIFNKVTDVDSVFTFATKRDPAQRNLDHLIQQNPTKRTKRDDGSSTATAEMKHMKVTNDEAEDVGTDESEEESEKNVSSQSSSGEENSDDHVSVDDSSEEDNDSEVNQSDEESSSEDADENEESSDEDEEDNQESSSNENSESNGEDDYEDDASSTNAPSSQTSNSDSNEPMGSISSSSSRSTLDTEEEFKEQWKHDFQLEEKDYINNPNTKVAPTTKKLESNSYPAQPDETGAHQKEEAGDPPSDQGSPSEHISDSEAVL